MKIRDKVNMRWEHVQNHRIVTDEDKDVCFGKEAAVFLRELFRAGRVDKIGEPLFRGGILVDEAVFRLFVCVFRLLVPPAGLEKAVKKGEKGRGGGAWESAPFRAGERVHVDPFSDRGKEEEGKNVGSGSDIYCMWGHFVCAPQTHPSPMKQICIILLHSYCA
jgi:hypothetical protein